MALFQYQALAEPTPRAATLPETAQLDKWYRQPVEPPRQRQRVTTVLGWSAVDAKQLTLKETVTVDRFGFQPPPAPRQLPRVTTALGWYAVDPKQLAQPEVVSADKWAFQFPPAPRQLPRLADRECLDYGGLVSTAFNPSAGFPWPVPQHSSVALKRLTDRECFDYGTTEVTNAFPWIAQNIPLPQPLKRLTDRECYDFGAGAFTAETVTADRWVQPQSLPTRPLPRTTNRDAGQPVFWAVLATTFNPGTGFPWPLPEPAPRQLRRELTYDGQFCTTLGKFVAETVTVDRWYSPVDVFRFTKRQTPENTVAWPATTVVFPDRWYVPLPLPNRPTKRLPNDAGPAPIVTVQPTTADRWYVQAQDPVRGRRFTIQPTYAYVRGLAETVTLDEWAGYWQPRARALSRTVYLEPACPEIVVVPPGHPGRGRFVADVYVPGFVAVTVYAGGAKGGDVFAGGGQATEGGGG